MIGKTIFMGTVDNQGLDLSNSPKGIYLVKDAAGRTAKVVLK
jgi:hypothetical protein